MDPIHVLIFYFLKIHFNSILPSTPCISSFHANFSFQYLVKNENDVDLR
jgi:hypothetical protein